MNNVPKISIVTPSYNQGKFLEETIRSVVDQAYSNLEYIIIDGGSTDNSVEIIKKHEKLLSYWVSEKDTGQSAAINKGFKQATGDIIAWLNSDDLYYESTFKLIAEYFVTHPEVDIVYGDVLNFSDTGKTHLVKNRFEVYDFFSRVSLHQPAIFWKRSLLEQTGMLDESLHYCMDYDLWMKLFMNFKSAKIEAVLAKFREHPHSKTNNNPIQLYEEYQIVVSRFFNALPSKIWRHKLNTLKVQYDKNEVYSSITKEYSKEVLKKLLLIYLNTSLKIEFTKKNYKRVRGILFKQPLLFFSITNLSIFIRTFFISKGLKKEDS